MYLFLEPKVPLNYPCDRGDECENTHASCQSGTCRCDPKFFPRNGQCGKLNNDPNSYTHTKMSLNRAENRMLSITAGLQWPRKIIVP